MEQVFTFSEEPVKIILQLLPSLLPGIEKIIAVYYSRESNGITSILIRKENDEYITESFQISDSSSFFNRMRSDNAPYSWLQKEDLPFEIKHKEKVQLEIFNELNNNILLIRLPDSIDSNNDLFFIFFNKGMGNFGTITPSRVLSTENKTIIGNILRNSLITFLGISQNDKQSLIALNENIRILITDRNCLRDELNITKEKYKEGLIRSCKSYLIDLTKRNGVIYKFSDDAIKKIREYNGDIENLKSVILKAAHFAKTMNIEGNTSDILIDDFHILMNEKEEIKQKEVINQNVKSVPAKYNKTFLLLEKLENAALNVKSKNLLLTGVNIGNEFPTPVTPPAISDALKKHRQKIIFLFNEYPSRWETIRKEFRPVQNILNVKPFPDQLSA